MKLNIRELRILSRLFCYNNKFELTITEIEDDFDCYISSWNNLRNKMEDWFFDYLSEKIYTLKTDNEELYLFRRDSEDLYRNEVEELLDKLKSEHDINSIKDFNNVKNKIFKENNYNIEKDSFDNYDDYYDYNNILNDEKNRIENLLKELEPVKFEFETNNYFLIWDNFSEEIIIDYNNGYETPGIVYFHDKGKLERIVKQINKNKITREQFIEAYKKVFSCL